MDLTEIRAGFGQNNNRIVIKGLSKRQKDLLRSGGVISAGVGIGVGLFSLYSINEPDVIPGEGVNPLDLDNTFEKSSYELPEDFSEEMTFHSSKPLVDMDQYHVSFNEAFKIAREEVGPGGWFVWMDKVFNTYYREEWEMLSQGEKTDYVASLKIEENDSIENYDEAASISSNEISREVEIHDKETSDVQIEPQVIQIINESGIENSDYNVSYKAENVDMVQIGSDSESLVFELQEDAVILEIPKGSYEDIDSMVFDASENNLFFNEREGTPESAVPIELKNIGSKDDSSDDIGLAQHWKNIVEEYPWGEAISHVDHPVIGPVSAAITDSGVQSALLDGTINQTEELIEYPWGETISKEGNISFAHDIQVVDDNESSLVNPIEIYDPGNPAEEYPWGEQVNQSNNFNISQVENPLYSNDPSLHDNLPIDSDDDHDFDEDK